MKITVIADTHYYSKQLGITGAAFEKQNSCEHKFLAESEEMITEAFSQITKSDTQAVLIAGDLTHNGEKCSHNEFKLLLTKLAKQKPVFVITAAHDWCANGTAKRFVGGGVSKNVETMKAHELAQFYYDFGLRQATSCYKTRLGLCSYTAQLDNNTVLLALNDDRNSDGKTGFSQKHLNWAVEQIKLAKRENKQIIAMHHHLLMPHVSPLLTKSACISDYKNTADALADAGLKYIFAGHSHIHNTKKHISQNGNVLYEINVASLVAYPAPIIEAKIGDSLEITSRHIEKFEYCGSTICAEQIKNRTLSMFNSLSSSAAQNDKADFEKRLNSLRLNGKKIATYHGLIRPVARYAANRKISTAHILPSARRIAKAHGDKTLLSFAEDLFISAVDGSKAKYQPSSDYYKFVTGSIKACGTLLGSRKVKNEVLDCAVQILSGGEIDSNNCVLN